MKLSKEERKEAREKIEDYHKKKQAELLDYVVKKIEEYKKDLLNEKKQIQEELKNLKEGLDFGDDVDSGDEETDESEEFANYIDVKMSLEESLDDINKALEFGKNIDGILGILVILEDKLGIWGQIELFKAE